MKKRFWFRILVIFCSIAILEIVLRLIGFGSVPVYYKSSRYEYSLVPNQSIQRFGNFFFINSLGMRSSEIAPGEKMVMGFGDSVFNGGVALSQNELASSIIDSTIASEFKNLRFTNTSAGSWGVSNAYNWFMEKDFGNPRAIVLVFSSHDYDDKMKFQDVVGEVPFYPDSQPLSALTDAVGWIYSRYFEKINWSELDYTREYVADSTDHDSAWEKFIEYSVSYNIPLIVYHHPDKSEALIGNWNKKGQNLEKLLISFGVEPISGLGVQMDESDYRDEIHPSASGQQKIAEAILPALNSVLKDE